MVGKTWKFGSNVDTDIIIPGQYLNLSDPNELAMHCMEGIDPGFGKKVEPGDVIVAENNFGCGSSREHAPMALKALGISCLIAKSIARIFFRNAINIGLPIIQNNAAASDIEEGDLVEIDYSEGVIKNLTKEKEYHFEAFPPFLEEIISSGGLMAYSLNTIKNRKS